MPTTRGLERLIFFTDAVVAIAITLLILPLVDSVSEAENATATAEQFFRTEGSQVVAFLISFAVIARLWVAHHALFEHIASYNGLVILLSLAWAFTIVVLPLPTAMSAEFDSEALTLGFYVGTMLASSLTLTLLAVTIRGDRTLEASANRIPPSAVQGSVITTVLFAVALVVGVLVPGVGYWGLLVLLLSGPIQIVVDRRAGRTR